MFIILHHSECGWVSLSQPLKPDAAERQLFAPENRQEWAYDAAEMDCCRALAVPEKCIIALRGGGI